MGDLAAGAEFAGYRIEALIGRGGMGVVYRATQMQLGRKVALKLIGAGSPSDAELRERFVTESRLAASVDHPHVIPVYAAGEQDGIAFLAMRYVPGDDLRSLVRREGRLGPERAARIVQQVGSALDAAHALGLVHRDVKPANVLLGPGDHAYLTDFGLTKPALSTDGPTRTGQWLGTPAYAAPEQIRGEAVDTRADVYALGCVLFYALTGRPPFPREGEHAITWAHVHDPPPRVSDLLPDDDGAFDAVVQEALAKAPDDRYQTASELGRAAAAAATHQAEPPPTLAGPVSKPAARHELIGRDSELAALEAALSRAAGGDPSLTIVAGEAGIGKTKLLRVLEQRARTAGVAVLRGECTAIGDDMPYAPLAGVLRDIAAGPGRDVLDALTVRAREDLAHAFPELMDDEPGEAPGDNRYAQSRLYARLLALLAGVCRQRPAAVLIEDVHWANRSTRDFLTFAARSMRGERLAIVLTCRTGRLPQEVRAWLADLRRQEWVGRLELSPLGRDELALLLAQAGPEPVDPAVADDVFARSEGNPFLAEELLAALGDGSGAAVPDSLRDILLLPVETLSATARDALRTLAIARRAVSHGLLQDAVAVPEAELTAALREAVTAQVIVHDTGYAFRHALVREAVEDELLPGERMPLHAAFARALAEHGGESAELARHWRAAGRRDAARAASVQAGEAAGGAFAFGEALGHFTRALELWDGEPGRIDVLADAAEAARNAGEFEQAAALCRSALDHAEVQADPARAAWFHERLARNSFGDPEVALASCRAALELLAPDDPLAVRALAGEGHVLMLVGRYEEARDRCAAALRLAADPYAQATLGLVLGFLERFEEGERQLREALGRATRIEDRARCHVNLAELLRLRGRVADALDITRHGIEVARGAGAEWSFGAFLAVNAAEDCLHLGRWDEADAQLARLAGRALERVTDVYRCTVAARLALARGETVVAREQLAAATALAAAGVPAEQAAPLAAALADEALRDGRPEDARRHVAEGLRAVGDEGDPLNTPALHVLGVRAELAADVAGLDGFIDIPVVRARRASAAAELEGPDPAAWSAAAAAWEALEAPFEAACARWREAEALLAIGDREGAAALLRDVHATATRLRAAPLVADVEALAGRGGLDVA